MSHGHRSSSPTTSQQPHQQPADGQQNQQEQNQPQKSENQSPSAGSSAVQNNEGRKISPEDIQLVQNLIERCLQLYMNQTEVINTLLNQAKIEPGFTSLVWQKLEEQNPDFFKAYYTRLKLKRHIMMFNHLLEQQVQLMQKMRILPTKSPVPLSNGIHHQNAAQVPIGYPMSALAVPGHPHMTSSVMPPSPNLMAGTPMSENFHSAQGSPGQSGGVDIHLGISPGLHPSSSGMAPDPGILGSSGFPFSSIGNPSDMSMIGLTSMSLDTPFISNDPHSQNIVSLSISTDEEDGSSTRESIGSLGPLPRNFSLSDLTVLGPNSDLGSLADYSSPFMSPETEGFLQSPDKDDLDDERMLESIHDLDFEDLK